MYQGCEISDYLMKLGNCVGYKFEFLPNANKSGFFKALRKEGEFVVVRECDDKGELLEVVEFYSPKTTIVRIV